MPVLSGFTPGIVDTIQLVEETPVLSGDEIRSGKQYADVALFGFKDDGIPFRISPYTIHFYTCNNRRDGFMSDADCRRVEADQAGKPAEVHFAIACPAMGICGKTIVRQAVRHRENAFVPAFRIQPAQSVVCAYPQYAIGVFFNAVDDVVRHTILDGI